MASRRLFLSLPFPDPKAIEKAIAGIRSKLNHSARWIPQENWHLTLHFLGSVEDEAVQKLLQAIAEVKVPRFIVDFTEWVAFPNHRAAHVLALADSNPAPALRALHQTLSEILRGLSLPVEDRAFVPHLTVARFNPPSHLRWGDTLPCTLVPNISGEIVSFALMESRLSSSGSKYNAVAQHPLLTE